MKELPCDDLFVLSRNYRAIYDNYLAKTEADELWEKTKDFEKVDKFCERIKLKQESALLLKNQISISVLLTKNLIILKLLMKLLNQQSNQLWTMRKTFMHI